MTRGTFPTLRRRAEAARDQQLRMLARLQALDDACARHMAHGAMAGADPLTDCIDQMQAAATEGAQPPTPYADGLPPRPPRHDGAWWVLGGTLVSVLALVAMLPPAPGVL